MKLLNNRLTITFSVYIAFTDQNVAGISAGDDDDDVSTESDDDSTLAYSSSDDGGGAIAEDDSEDRREITGNEFVKLGTIDPGNFFPFFSDSVMKQIEHTNNTFICWIHPVKSYQDRCFCRLIFII